MHLLMILLALTTHTWAESPTILPPLAPPLAIYDATIEPADQGATAAASMVIHNPANTPVTITGATSPMAERVLMQSYVKVNGVDQIYPQKSIDIAPKADLAIVPYGLEFRLLNTTTALTYGMDVPLTLHFPNGATRTIRLTIQANEE